MQFYKVVFLLRQPLRTLDTFIQMVMVSLSTLLAITPLQLELFLHETRYFCPFGDASLFLENFEYFVFLIVVGFTYSDHALRSDICEYYKWFEMLQ